MTTKRLCHTNAGFFLGQEEKSPERRGNHKHGARDRARMQPQRAKGQITVIYRDQHDDAAQRLMDRPQDLDGVPIPAAFQAKGVFVQKAQPIRRRHYCDEPDIQPSQKRIHGKRLLIREFSNDGKPHELGYAMGRDCLDLSGQIATGGGSCYADRLAIAAHSSRRIRRRPPQCRRG